MDQQPARTSPRRKALLLGAAVLGASGVATALLARRAEAKHPPVGRFIEVEGIRLHYVEQGEGPPVLLLHGNGMTLGDWQASGVTDLAARHHRVVAFDRPGFGYSDRPRGTAWTPQAQAALLVQAMAALGIDRLVVAGHSWGTMVALAMALDHPSHVAGLVLLSGYYYATLRPDVPAMALPAIPLLGDILAHTVTPLSGAVMAPAWIKASFAPAPVDPNFASNPLALSLRPRQVRATAADAAMMVPAALALSLRYAELALPVTIMAGSGDCVTFPWRHAERAAREIAGSRLRLIEGQGHLFHYAVPEQVATAIDEITLRA